MAPIPEMDTIWMDGELVPWAEAKIHVLTHALHYGSGVFEGIRAYKTERGVGRAPPHRAPQAPRALGQALLHAGAVHASSSSTTPPSRCSSPTSSTPATSGRSSSAATARWACTRMNAPVEVVIAAWPWGTYLGEEGIKHGVRAKTSQHPVARPHGAGPRRQGHGPVPQQHPRQDRGAQRRLRRGRHAHGARPRRRGLGREHLRACATACS